MKEDKDSRRKLMENPEVQDIMVGLLRFLRFSIHYEESIVEAFVADELSKLNEPDPIITTHDGVIVKPGQKVWIIIWTNLGPKIAEEMVLHHSEDRLWFSTKSAAEAYLETLFEGYVAPFDMWRGRIKKGELFLFKLDGCGYGRDGLYLPAEIVTTWEKRYRKPLWK